MKRLLPRAGAVEHHSQGEEVGIDLANSYAYTDSVTDMPMLEAVGNPVPVNPDKDLRRVALEKGWETRVFRKPISLRSRLPQFRPPELSRTNIAYALTGAALIGAAIIYVTRERPE